MAGTYVSSHWHHTRALWSLVRRSTRFAWESCAAPAWSWALSAACRWNRRKGKSRPTL
jgi:hypothetical protein